MHYIGHTGLLIEPRHQVVGKTGKIIPQLLLGQILLRPGVNAYYSGLVRKRFDGHCIVVTYLRIDQPLCNQVHALDAVAFSKRPGLIDDILGLPTGIGVAAKLHIVAANQAVNTDQQQILFMSAILHCVEKIP